MNLYQTHIDRLSKLTDRFGFNPAEVAQGSPEWLQCRLGVLTASKADKIVAGKDTDGRMTYMSELIAEIVNCAPATESNFKQTEWGKKFEPAARDALAVTLGFVNIEEIALMYLDDDLRVAISPDGVSDNTVYEIKAPFDATNHAKHMAFKKVKPEWQWQRQMQLLVSGAQRHIFCTYDPRAILADNLHYVETEIDEKKQATLRDAIPSFIADLDAALESIGVKFGDHFNYIKQQRSN